MIIVVKKDGQIVTDDGNPVEVKALEDAAMLLADPKDGDSIVYNAASGCWVSGAVDALPAVSSTDNGKVLTVVEGAWAKADASGGGGALIVTVDDNTSALDKTWQEIDAATSTSAVVAKWEEESGAYTLFNLTSATPGDDQYPYELTFTDGSNTYTFKTDTANGYPVLDT